MSIMTVRCDGIWMPPIWSVGGGDGDDGRDDDGRMERFVRTSSTRAGGGCGGRGVGFGDGDLGSWFLGDTDRSLAAAGRSRAVPDLTKILESDFEDSEEDLEVSGGFFSVLPPALVEDLMARGRVCHIFRHFSASG